MATARKDGLSECKVSFIYKNHKYYSRYLKDALRHKLDVFVSRDDLFSFSLPEKPKERV